MKKSKILLVVMAILPFMFWSCQKQETIKIGAVLALSGSGANYGNSLKNGIELAVQEINQSGGINGQVIEVIYEDTKADPKTGVSAFNKLSSIDKVPVVIGSISGVVLSVAPVADEKQVVFINASATSPLICDKATNFLFSLISDGETESQFFVDDVVSCNPNESVAVLYINNPTGVGSKDKFIEQMKAINKEVAIIEAFEPNATDFRTQLKKIKESKATIGYLFAFSSQEFAKVPIQSKEMGMDIQWYSYSGFETEETLEVAKNAANGVRYSYPIYDENGLMKSFQENYLKTHGTWADIYTVTAYDGIKLIAEVMKKYGTKSLDIQKGLRELDGYDGVFGNISFEKNQCVNKPLGWKTVENGKYKILKNE